jgi:predicted O-linked N-acetylglucosamine transferase (SPINDLY family)
MSAEACKKTADRLIAEGNRAEDAGRFADACARYGEAVQVAPRYAKAHLNLGIALEALGRLAEAAASYEAVLAMEPAHPYAHYNLGKLHFTRGAPQKAERHLRAALECRPEITEARIVLAHVLDTRGDAAGAAAAFEAALNSRPEDFGAWFGFGQTLRRLGRLDEAHAAFERAVALDPANADAHGALFDLHQGRGNLESAAKHVEAVLRQRPDWADALLNYGIVLMRMQRLSEAEAAFRRLIALDPQYRTAYRMLGSVLHRAARIDEVLALCRAARERFPDWLELESFELFALNVVEDISAEELFERHRKFGARLECAHPARTVPFPNTPDPERRLRVGYLSGDFSYHVVSLFMLPLAERCDRGAIETYCYSVGGTTDAVTRQLMAASDVWRDAATMSDVELSDAIRSDRIDILVDLAGHTGIARLGVFAQQPAPVQATWLGYLNTTGLTRVQYRITDSYCDPPGLTDRYHTEALARLPRHQWCYRPFVTVEPASAAPVERNGFVTFGSFNQAHKLSPSVRQLWAQIMQALPDSRLIVAGVQDEGVRELLRRDFAGCGIDRARIAFRPYGSLPDYYRWYNEVDIGLDTTLYSGGTTTLDALWMGVPVVTLPGERPMSRSAASILTGVGLEDWIASSREDYVRRGAAFARDTARLAGLRRTLRARLRASPLMDEARFARDMEALYRRMWRRWCEGAR